LFLRNRKEIANNSGKQCTFTWANFTNDKNQLSFLHFQINVFQCHNIVKFTLFLPLFSFLFQIFFMLLLFFFCPKLLFTNSTFHLGINSIKHVINIYCFESPTKVLIVNFNSILILFSWWSFFNKLLNFNFFDWKIVLYSLQIYPKVCYLPPHMLEVF